MKNIRVLYIEAAYGFGGSLTGLLQLFQNLPPHIEPVLVTPFDPWTHIEKPVGLIHRHVDITAPIVKQDGHWLPGILRYRRDEFLPWKRNVQELIRQFSPQMVHANNSLMINYACGHAAKACRVPSICHQKDFEYEGKLIRLMAKFSRFDHHIATSHANATQLIQLGISKKRCTAIYEPVVGPTATQLQYRQSLGHRDLPVVAMHSMVIHWKGQHVFLRAIAEHIRRGNVAIKPVIAGSAPAGEPGYMNELKTLAKELGISDQVDFIGHQRDVYQFLAGVDVAVHASVSPEPFGRVVPEAMLMGIGGIVSTGGGPAEYVTHGQTGLHAASGDVSGLADAIEQLAMSPETRESMGVAARAFALENFDASRLTGNVVALYERILAGR